MTNQDIADLRKHYQLSAAMLGRLMIDPVTKKQVSARTVYRWEHLLPEVITLPDWVDSAAAALMAKATRHGRAKFVARGTKRWFRDDATSQSLEKTWNGAEWVAAYQQ